MARYVSRKVCNVIHDCERLFPAPWHEPKNGQFNLQQKEKHAAVVCVMNIQAYFESKRRSRLCAHKCGEKSIDHVTMGGGSKVQIKARTQVSDTWGNRSKTLHHLSTPPLLFSKPSHFLSPCFTQSSTAPYCHYFYFFHSYTLCRGCASERNTERKN